MKQNFLKILIVVIIAAAIIAAGYFIFRPKKQAIKPAQEKEAAVAQQQEKEAVPEAEQAGGATGDEDNDEDNVETVMNDEEQGVEKDINEGPVDISPQQEQAAGIKTTFVRKRQMFLSLKSAGSPAQVNETGNDSGIAVIKAQIYEGEENLVKIGQKAEITSAAHPGKKFTGSVSEVGKRTDPASKILKISIEAPNKSGLLKPGMEVEAIIYMDLGQRLCVPAESIFDTGEKQIVFLKKAPGKYGPADVETGYETDDYTEIVSGVKDGDEIAASSTALIDLKTKLESEANAATKTAK